MSCREGVAALYEGGAYDRRLCRRSRMTRRRTAACLQRWHIMRHRLFLFAQKGIPVLGRVSRKENGAREKGRPCPPPSYSPPPQTSRHRPQEHHHQLTRCTTEFSSSTISQVSFSASSSVWARQPAMVLVERCVQRVEEGKEAWGREEVFCCLLALSLLACLRKTKRAGA